MSNQASEASISVHNRVYVSTNSWLSLDSSELPDDFKYGVSVYESAPEIRQAFVRKVYSILFAQLLGKSLFELNPTYAKPCCYGVATAAVSGVMKYANASVWIQDKFVSFVPYCVQELTIGLH